MTVGRRPMTVDRRPTTDDRRPTTDDRRPTTEDRRPKTEDRMKIGMISLGCPKNLVDSEVMLGLAQQQGHQLTRDAADADVLVVNTCAFIDKAKQQSIDTILEMAEIKKSGACRRFTVMRRLV